MLNVCEAYTFKFSTLQLSSFHSLVGSVLKYPYEILSDENPNSQLSWLSFHTIFHSSKATRIQETTWSNQNSQQCWCGEETKSFPNQQKPKTAFVSTFNINIHSHSNNPFYEQQKQQQVFPPHLHLILEYFFSLLLFFCSLCRLHLPSSFHVVCILSFCFNSQLLSAAARGTGIAHPDVSHSPIAKFETLSTLTS